MARTHRIVNASGQEIFGRLVENLGPMKFVFQIDGSLCSTQFEHNDWDITELPKPLPGVPGFYISKSSLNNPVFARALYMFYNDGWNTDDNGEWHGIPDTDVPRDLVRLVPEVY